MNTKRYTAKRISDRMIHVLDTKFGNAVAAHVFVHETVQGSGWKLAPISTSRTMSRKLHVTPEAAIASMKYMTLVEARDALTLQGTEKTQ